MNLIGVMTGDPTINYGTVASRAKPNYRKSEDSCSAQRPWCIYLKINHPLLVQLLVFEIRFPWIGSGLNLAQKRWTREDSASQTPSHNEPMESRELDKESVGEIRILLLQSRRLKPTFLIKLHDSLQGDNVLSRTLLGDEKTNH